MAELMSAAELLNDAGANRPSREQSAPKAAPTDDPITDPDEPSFINTDDLTRDEKKLRDAIAEVYTYSALAVSMVDGNIAGAIMQSGDDAATAWVLYARNNPKVKKALKSLVSTSALGMLVMAHAPIITAVIPAVQSRFFPAKNVDEDAAAPPFAVPGL